MQPRAFVAMPYRRRAIEVDGRTIAVNFDAVYDHLIAPAARVAGLMPFRADQEAGAGDIRIDMFFELVTADFVIADVSILNTNVFYELGVRHGVSPRGVFLVHGGWTPLPFDNAPDRTLQYDGHLFVQRRAEDKTREAKLEAEVQRLARALRNAVEADESTTGSPVYAQLPGLEPPRTTGIRTSRARYFGGLQEDGAGRVRIARRQRRPEDILTLAESAPTRFQHDRMLLSAARALVEIQRFDAARDILTDVLRRRPEDIEVGSQLALAMGRLGRVDEAAEQIERVARIGGDNTEVQGTLGRTFKDMWRLRWEQGTSVEKRCELAIHYRAYVDDSIRCYQAVHARNPASYYNGINYLSLTRLVAHAAAVVEGRRTAPMPRALGDAIATVRFAARAVREVAEASSQTENVAWTTATLAELALVLSQPAAALKWYVRAASARDVTRFQIESMLAQLKLFSGLGCEQAVVTRIAKVLDGSVERLPEYETVTVAAWPTEHGCGDWIAAPTQAAVAAQLKGWGIGPRSLAICTPYALPDLLFTEACLARRAQVRWLLPSDEAAFVGALRRKGGNERVDSYLRLQPRVSTREQPDHLGRPEGIDPDRRNDLWLLNTVRAEARLETLHTVLWGDVPADPLALGSRLNALGGRLAVISPGDRKNRS
jgi:tetratricopeptide (TPR) repeat protein